MKKVNERVHEVTIEDIENHKQLTKQEIDKDLNNLLKFPASENSNCFYGNPTLYHFQLKNLLRCRREKQNTIYEVYEDKDKWNKLLEYTRKRDRSGRTAAGNIWECFRINTGSVVMFKATTAKYIYKKYGAKRVLDPTAGWGGRMLGAWALGIDYTGIDTNTNLADSYNSMISTLHSKTGLYSSELKMIYHSCLEVDLSTIDYDFVLTSPPYFNLEVYENMPLWKSKESFLKDFFAPLWERCYNHMSNGGTLCFNIPVNMMEKAIELGVPRYEYTESLNQQTGSNKKQELIFIWKKRKV